MQRLTRFLKNAMILGGTTIFMRIIAVAFNAYTANQIGAEGMGLFSLISSVYLFAVTLATSGIHLAVTMLVSEELGRENDAGAIRTVKVCVLAALGFGGAASALLFFGAGYIAENILGDTRTYLSLRAFAAALPFIALSNVFAGYFNAVRRIAKSASASMIEQFVKIGITISLLLTIAPRGIEYACLALVIGSAASEALSFLYLFLFYIFDKKRHIDPRKGYIPEKMRNRVFAISLPIAFSSYLRSGLVTIEHILIPIGLRKSGADYATALASYGTVHGMALPLILFPSAVCATFAGLIVPEFSELAARYGKVHDNRHICYIVRRALSGAFFFGIGVAGIFICFAEPLGLLVYHNADAARFIAVLAPLVPVMYLDTTVDGMLKGLGQQVPSMIYNIIDASMSVLLVWLLIPKIGVAGYIVCIYFTEILNMSLSLSRLLLVTGAHIPVLRAICGPTLCIIGATSLTLLILRPLFAGDICTLPFVIIGILMSIGFYVILLRTTHSISGEDAAWLHKVLRRKRE